MAGKKVIVLEYFVECAVRSAQRVAQFTGKPPDTITSGCASPDLMLREMTRGYGLVQVIKHPASYHAQKKYYDEILTIWYNLSKKEKSVKKRTTVLCTGKFFLQEEVARAICKTGDTLLRLEYTSIHDIVEYEQRIQKIVLRENPSSFFSINMLGIDSSGIISEYTLRHGIPVVVWFVDDPRPIVQSKLDYITRNMVAFCWERSYIDELIKAGFHSVHYLPLATDPEIFKKSKEAQTRDVAFVGSSMAGDFRTSLRSKFLWNTTIEAVVVNVALQLMSTPLLDIDRAVSDEFTSQGSVPPFTDQRNRTWLRSYIIHTAGMLKRQRMIQSVQKKMKVAIYGDQKGWREICGTDSVCSPEIDYRTKCAGIYRSTKVNLNTTSCQMLTAVNQRVFDVPACGGFLLTDYQSDLDELFQKDELAVYRTLEELNELILYYLSNDSAREKLAAKASVRILREHTYETRYKKLQSILKMSI
jgi:spore maturation protein CgeB